MKAIVIMPTYNEAENLPRMVEAIRGLGVPGLQILVVDDNSPDGTGEIADGLAEQFPNFFAGIIHRAGKLGLGTAYIAGFTYALEHGADYAIQMDADFSHSPQMLPVFLDAIQSESADVIVGSRYVSGGRLSPNWGLKRRLLSWGGNLYARVITGLPIRDVTGGFRCYRRGVLESLDLSAVKSSGFAFQVELAYACHKKGYTLKELPIEFNDRAYGQSKMSTHIIWEAFWTVWRVKLRY